ncbi:MAG: RNA methyltransferase, partial [Gemmatimonadota bacterium]
PSEPMALLTTIRDLHRRKGRERRNLALAEGIRLVEEMLATGAACKGVAVSPALEGTPRGARLRQRLAAAGFPVEEISDVELTDVAATEHPQGVVAVYQAKSWSLDDCAAVARHPLVILDGVQDPGNVGTIARTAVAFGASGLVALPGTADLTNPKAVRGAMGALFRLPHCHAGDDDTLAMMARRGIALWAMAMDGEVLDHGAPATPVALLLGNEGAGVRTELLQRATRRVTIPIDAAAESLNVAVAAAIALHEVTR